jgi:hypothetical protein
VGDTPQRREGPSLTVVEAVRCLECGALYAKPSGGGTVRQNPGCPECGYLGWLPAAIPLTPASARARFSVDRLTRRSARSG